MGRTENVGQKAEPEPQGAVKWEATAVTTNDVFPWIHQGSIDRPERGDTTNGTLGGEFPCLVDVPAEYVGRDHLGTLEMLIWMDVR